MSPGSAEELQAMSDARLPESDLDTLLIKNIGDLEQPIQANLGPNRTASF